MSSGNKKSSNISVGQRFFNLVTVKKKAKKKGRLWLWECLCDCGQTNYVASADLNRGHSKTCGHCGTQELHKGQYSKYPELKIWKNIKSRCNNVNSPNYPYYGGRGIKVKLTFQELLDEVGERPTPKHTIDRIDVNKHYEKGNIRWALRQQQQRNTRKGQDPSASIYKKYNRWISRISIAGKTTYLGSFANKEEAKKARLEAIEKQNLMLRCTYV